MFRFLSEHPGCWLMLLLVMATGAGNAQVPLEQPAIQRIYATANPAQDSVFRLGSTITLEVRGLSPWMKAQEERLVRQGFDVQKAHAKARNLVLYIDDAPLIGMPPLTVYTDETAGPAPSPAELQAAAIAGPDKVVFQLQRNVSNYRYWNVVYGSPWDFSYPGKIGIGYEDQVFTELYPGKTATIRLELIQPSSLWLSLLSTGVLAFGTLVLASRSWLLRETAGGRTALTVAVANPPYSLAKIQLAWWTFIIMGSYLLIYCATGEMADISATSLALLGISAGTTALNGLIAPTPPPAKKTRAANAATQSRGWLMDVLSDEHGVSMHRLQKLVITVAMGYFFVRCVYNTVAMPVWTNNQMLLLAVSNATYLGLKWQENRSYGEDEMAMLPGNQLFAGPPQGMPLTQYTNAASSFESHQVAGGTGSSGYIAGTSTESPAPQETEMTQVDGHMSKPIVGNTNSINSREG